jgi:hypothetical protein
MRLRLSSFEEDSSVGVPRSAAFIYALERIALHDNAAFFAKAVHQRG